MTSKEQFNEWFYEYTGCNPKDSRYVNMVEMYWMTWRASRAAIEIELPEPCSPGHFCVDIPAQAHHEVIEAIENAGLKVKK